MGCFRSIGVKDTRYDRLARLNFLRTLLMGVLSLVRTIFAAIRLSIAKLLTLRLSAFWSLSSCICTSKMGPLKVGDFVDFWVCGGWR